MKLQLPVEYCLKSLIPLNHILKLKIPACSIVMLSVVINVNFTKSSINNSLVILAAMAAISLVRTFFQIAAENSILAISDKKMQVISVDVN